MSEPIDRRSFLTGVAAAGAWACNLLPLPEDDGARLTVRVTAPTETPVAGLQPLGAAAGRDGLLYVPKAYSPSKPLALIVLLHGAGGRAQNWFGSFGTRADAGNFVAVAVESRGRTWDAVLGGFGPDVEFMNRALRETFRRCAVDPARIVLAGFSDGASYAISLGAANGAIFSRIVAFSPGFRTNAERQGKPRIFVSHGTNDPILPIDQTSRALVPRLRREGYTVEYVEFAGGHEMPATISDRAIEWALA
ncbi:MAG: alpha/beta hydrolase [Gemmatimonadaceae bacterium]